MNLQMLGTGIERCRADPYQTAASLYSIRHHAYELAGVDSTSYQSKICHIDETSSATANYMELDVGPLFPSDVVFILSKLGCDLR